MFAKVFIVAAVVACVAAAPGYLHAAPIAVPLATSHTSRIDIHSKPILTVSAPIIKTVVAAPIIVPAAVSHASRVEVHAAPIVTYGLGGHGLGLGGLALGGHGGLALGGHGGLGLGGHGLALAGHGLGGHYW